MRIAARLERIERQQQQRWDAYLDSLTPAQMLMLLKTDANEGIAQHGLAHVVEALDAQGMHPDWIDFFTDGDMDAATLEEVAARCALPEGEEFPWDWPRLSQGDIPLP